MQHTPEMELILEDFALFDDWEDKYAYIIELGTKLEPLDASAKTDANKVHGCTSQVWLIHQKQANGCHHYRGDSDAMIVKGLVALLLKIYSGQKQETIEQIDIESLFTELGLKQYLSPSRSNGFFSMVQRIQQLAAQ